MQMTYVGLDKLSGGRAQMAFPRNTLFEDTASSLLPLLWPLTTMVLCSLNVTCDLLQPTPSQSVSLCHFSVSQTIMPLVNQQVWKMHVSVFYCAPHVWVTQIVILLCVCEPGVCYATLL